MFKGGYVEVKAQCAAFHFISNKLNTYQNFVPTAFHICSLFKTERDFPSFLPRGLSVGLYVVSATMRFQK